MASYTTTASGSGSIASTSISYAITITGTRASATVYPVTVQVDVQAYCNGTTTQKWGFNTQFSTDTTTTTNYHALNSSGSSWSKSYKSGTAYPSPSSWSDGNSKIIYIYFYKNDALVETKKISLSMPYMAPLYTYWGQIVYNKNSASATAGSVKKSDPFSTQSFSTTGSSRNWTINAKATPTRPNVVSYETATWKVTYNLNGGTSVSPATQNPERSVSVPYTSDGWARTSGGVVAYTAGNSYSWSCASTSSSSPTQTTIYAHWVAGTPSYGNWVLRTLPTPTRDNSSTTPTAFTIQFNANGGTVYTSSGITSLYSETYKWTFKEWNMNASGTGTKVVANSTKFNAATTIYAQWTSSIYSRTGGYLSSLPTPSRSETVDYNHTVTFNADGGAVSPQTATTYGGTATTSYSFTEWNTEASGTDGETVTTSYRFLSSRMIYARWSPSGSSTTPGYLASLPTPTKTGYNFNGWYTGPNGTGSRVYANSTSFSSNSTIYAYWTETPKTYWGQLAFNPLGGSWSDDTTTTKYSTSKSGTGTGSSATVSISLISTTISKLGYTFGGWSETSGGTVAVSDPFSFQASGTSQTSPTIKNLYAIWTKSVVNKFYWDTASTDPSLIATGQPIANITAARWNKLCRKIKEVSDLESKSYSHTDVHSGDRMTAVEFNAARTGISNLVNHGTLPGSVTANVTPITAAKFQGTGSLKSALNTAIDDYNNQ